MSIDNIILNQSKYSLPLMLAAIRARRFCGFHNALNTKLAENYNTVFSAALNAHVFALGNFNLVFCAASVV